MGSLAGGLGKSDTLRLVVVLKNTEDVERISNHFRNGGVAVRGTSPNDMTEFLTALQHPVDVILCDNSNPALTVPTLASALRGSGKSIPLIALLDQFDDKHVFDLLLAGATQCVLRGHVHFIDHVVRQEWSNSISRNSTNRLLQQLDETNKRCDNLIDSSRDPIAYIHQGMHIRANSAYLETFGFENFDDIEGLSLLDLISAKNVADFKILLKQQAKGENTREKIVVDAQKASGEEFPVVMEFSPALYEGEECLQVMVHAKQPDIIDPVIMGEILARDTATGSLSRAGFLEEMERRTAAADQPYVFALCKPDHYNKLLQNINLTAADALLQSMVSRLADILPQTAVIGRLGDAQFGILAPVGSAAAAKTLCEQINSSFHSHLLEAGEHSLSVTVSVFGLYLHHPSRLVVETVLLDAIKGLYELNNAGENAVRVVDPEEAAKGDQKHTAQQSAQIEDALKNKRFYTTYAPIIALHGHSFDFYAAHTVLYNADNTLLNVPESTPAVLLEQWQRNAVVHVLDALSATPPKPNTKVILPLGSTLVDDTNSLEWLQGLLTQRKLSAELFVVELSETSIFTKLKTAQELGKGLKDAGFDLGLGHFGSSANSLHVMQHLNPQWVRIDAELAVNLAGQADSQQKLKTLAEAAQAQEKKVISCGIEDAMSMSVVYGAMIDYAQGEFLAPSAASLTYSF